METLFPFARANKGWMDAKEFTIVLIRCGEAQRVWKDAATCYIECYARNSLAKVQRVGREGGGVGEEGRGRVQSHNEFESGM